MNIIIGIVRNVITLLTSVSNKGTEPLLHDFSRSFIEIVSTVSFMNALEGFSAFIYCACMSDVV
jgi:hypothetical protein